MIRINNNKPSHLRVVNIILVTIVIILLTVNIQCNSQIDSLESEVKKYKSKYFISNENLNSLNSKLQLIQSEVDNLNLELKDKNEVINNLNSEIKNLKKKPSVSRGSNGRLLGTFEATAYTDDVQSQGKWVGQTATGLKPQVGIVAVDPNVIPLGTKLYIEGYGNAIAGDTGGAIKGNIIDLFMNTRNECTNWGRRQVKVYRR